MGFVVIEILKWIFTVLGILLLVLLALLLIVLLVPIRYQASGSLADKVPQGKGQATWFFRLVKVEFQYEEGVRVTVRVMGRVVYALDQTKEDGNEG